MDKETEEERKEGTRTRTKPINKSDSHLTTVVTLMKRSSTFSFVHVALIYQVTDYTVIRTSLC